MDGRKHRRRYGKLRAGCGTARREPVAHWRRDRVGMKIAPRCRGECRQSGSSHRSRTCRPVKRLRGRMGEHDNGRR